MWLAILGHPQLLRHLWDDHPQAMLHLHNSVVRQSHTLRMAEHLPGPHQLCPLLSQRHRTLLRRGRNMAVLDRPLAWVLIRQRLIGTTSVSTLMDKDIRLAGPIHPRRPLRIDTRHQVAQDKFTNLPRDIPLLTVPRPNLRMLLLHRHSSLCMVLLLDLGRYLKAVVSLGLLLVMVKPHPAGPLRSPLRIVNTPRLNINNLGVRSIQVPRLARQLGHGQRHHLLSNSIII